MDAEPKVGRLKGLGGLGATATVGTLEGTGSDGDTVWEPRVLGALGEY